MSIYHLTSALPMIILAMDLGQMFPYISLREVLVSRLLLGFFFIIGASALCVALVGAAGLLSEWGDSRPGRRHKTAHLER
jgi:hypothetical protein